MHETIVLSIKWTNDELKIHKQKVSHEIKELKFFNHNENYTCEVIFEIPTMAKYQMKQKLKKSILLKIKNIESIIDDS